MLTAPARFDEVDRRFEQVDRPFDRPEEEMRSRFTEIHGRLDRAAAGQERIVQLLTTLID